MQRRSFTKKYWKAIDSLYGEQIPVEGGHATPKVKKASSGAKKAVKLDCPKEQQEQFVFVAWLRAKNIKHQHAANGGYRDIREAAKFKRLGVSAGFPDIEIPYRRKGYGCLYIEIKRRNGGVLSESQKEWRDHLIKEGYAWYEGKGADECISIVCDYLGLQPEG